MNGVIVGVKWCNRIVSGLTREFVVTINGRSGYQIT